MDSKKHDHPQIHRNIHPPIVALGFILASYLLGWLIEFSPGKPPSLGGIGFSLVCTGLLFGAFAMLEFRKAHTTLDPHGAATQLVRRGVYRISRNPIYLGFLLMVIGFPMFSGLYWGILMAPLYAGTMNHLVIEREERYLEGKFQQEYVDYKSRVRRWL